MACPFAPLWPPFGILRWLRRAIPFRDRRFRGCSASPGPRPRLPFHPVRCETPETLRRVRSDFPPLSPESARARQAASPRTLLPRASAQREPWRALSALAWATAFPYLRFPKPARSGNLPWLPRRSCRLFRSVPASIQVRIQYLPPALALQPALLLRSPR